MAEDAADEHTLGETDQTLSDADQTASDVDQTAADADQEAADRDQAASDEDLAHGSDQRVHAATRELRDRSAHDRRASADERLEAAAGRDEAAAARDRQASLRDRQADRRDHAFAAREGVWDDATRAAEGAKGMLRAFDIRKQASTDRAAAAAAREAAAVDRQRAAADRAEAARDRARARADRETLLEQLVAAETDALTGARTRGAGLADLEHEIARSRRTSAPLAVAYVDVVGLKSVNDAHGHAAGDAMLKRAVDEIRGQLRSYDVIVRVGGDEFVCIMSGATVAEAGARFRAVQTALAAAPVPCAVKIGLAALDDGDSAADLVARADAELPSTPGR